MKILLAAVNAKYIHSNPAVHSLRAYAPQWKEHIGIAEYTINNRTEAILADLYRQAPEVIAFSCYIWNWSRVQELLEELPKILPDTDIWLGGPEVSYDAPTVLRKYPRLSGVMIGEGEETFRELARHYFEGDPELTGIAGLCLPGSPPFFTAARALLEMDALPFFYEDLRIFENRILYYESSRGCPFACSYCLSSLDKRVRLRSLELVKRELQFFLDRRVLQVKFVDRTFNCDPGHACGIWSYLQENDNGVTNFHFEISADLLTEEELTILSEMRPGLIQLEIGVQSVNPTALREAGRRTDLNKLREHVERIRAGRNIHQRLDLIAGLPCEDYESFKRSFNAVYAMKPDQLQLGFLKTLKGSPLYERAAEYGLVYRSKPPYEILRSKWISYGELLQLKQVEEMVELYYNSNQFRHTLRSLTGAFDTAFSCFERLAAYYERNGYFVNAPARVYRYEILLGFAAEADGERIELYRELLTYDLYLREKCKSRPGFARDLTPYKEKLRELGKGSGPEHIEVFYYSVWEEEEPPKKSEEPFFVRFCYEERSPLDHNARVLVERPRKKENYERAKEKSNEKEYESDSGSAGSEVRNGL